MKKSFLLYFLILVLVSCSEKQSIIDLSGKWEASIDTMAYTVLLPGSLTENRVGTIVKDSSVNMLSEPVRFEGKVVFEKEIEIPLNWTDKYVKLYMERTKVSEVFINDSLIGLQNSVSAPHIYYIRNVFKPGKNRLKITVDNTKSLLPLGGSHAYSEHTQTNWNGILGEFYLECLNDVEIQNVRINSLTNGKCSLSLKLFNTKNENLDNKNIFVIVSDSSGNSVIKKQLDVHVVSGTSVIETTFDIKDPCLWDEYNPYLYCLRVEMPGNDSQEVRFGIRNFKTRNGQFVNNERIVFLRGKQEGGVFPLTGYPSMKKKDWDRYFSIVKSYGINHVRYHSWTPPAAAFESADSNGIFMQSELPLWGQYTSEDTTLINYMKAEGEKIMEQYGNHPYFVMFTLGNELTGDAAIMSSVVDHLKSLDDRRLYASGSNNFHWDPKTDSSEDFFVSMRSGKMTSGNHTDLRGSFSFADSDSGGIINCQKPNTKRCYSAAIDKFNKPVVGHETGQYQTYPNFTEITKYKGVMKPLNLEVFKKRLDAVGMLSQSDDFLKSSGALSALCYREEIEMALRTPGFGGFQLLDLQDYPGQGTALVGILDAFMEPKGIISPEKWMEFCTDVVPLALFSTYCWTNNEVFTADIAIANYSDKSMKEQTIHWTLVNADNKIVYEDSCDSQDLVQGGVTRIKSIKIPLNQIAGNQKMSLVVQVENTRYTNAWDIWVYTTCDVKIQEGYVGDVLVTRDKQACMKYADQGKPALYIPHHTEIKSNSVGGLFITDFWNYRGFEQATINQGKEPSPGTLGLLMDPAHKLFSSFPTDNHTNWQWWNMIKHSRPMILDAYPVGYKPIVQVVDNLGRNHKLGLIYEMPDTNGQVLVCTSDLFSCKDEPEVKALYKSMLDYLQSEYKK